MRYIFILLFLSLGLSALAQQNIVESFSVTVPEKVL